MAYKRILLRRDTAATWTSANSILASGEIGYETDTGRFKIGNASTAWTSLAYSAASLLDDLGNVTVPSPASGDLLKWNGSAWVNAAGYALLASPTFTGTPTLPTGTIATTQSTGNNTTAVATTAFVTTAITNITPSTTVLDGGTPETLQFYVMGAVDAGVVV